MEKNERFTPLGVQHKRIADYYQTNFRGHWAECDDYGLRHLAAHLAAEVSAAKTPATRDKALSRFFAAVLNEQYRQAQRERLADLRPTLDDLTLALNMALQRDDLAKAVACCGAYRDSIRSGDLFKQICNALDAGQMELALKRAEFYSRWPDWQRVLLLYLAWRPRYATTWPWPAGSWPGRRTSPGTGLPSVRVLPGADRPACSTGARRSPAEVWLAQWLGNQATPVLQEHTPPGPVSPPGYRSSSLPCWTG